MSGGRIIDNETATTTITETSTNNYPTDQVMEQMAAGAFRLLCEHLRQRSDQVQNIDLMTIGGFCRNCLAKVRRQFSMWHMISHHLCTIFICILAYS